MIRLGYACVNLQLKNKNIVTDRSVKIKTIYDGNVNYDKLIEISNSNLNALYEILKWNEKNNITFYRASSNIFPHITNSKLIKGGYKTLLYELDLFSDKLKIISNFIKKHKHRVTFHPDPFLSLGGKNKVLINTKRELYFHAKLMDLMELDYNSVMVVHGGGIYKEKEKTIRRWISNFDLLDDFIKRRMVLENDEYSYSLDDVLYISKHVKKFKVGKFTSRLPVVLDIFHHECYKKEQIPISYAVPLIIDTWKLSNNTSRLIKMHISEQRENERLGTHSDYVKTLPHFLISLNIDLDLMIEAKEKEKAIEYLRKRYPVS